MKYDFIQIKEATIIDIKINKHSKMKVFINCCYNKIEDITFSFIMKLPEHLIPVSLMNWMDKYTIKRINQLKQQNIKNTWKNMYLQKAVDEISNRQKD